MPGSVTPRRAENPHRRSIVVGPPLPSALVLGLFFLSGASGLVYEVVWIRLLTLTSHARRER